MTLPPVWSRRATQVRSKAAKNPIDSRFDVAHLLVSRQSDVRPGNCALHIDGRTAGLRRQLPAMEGNRTR